MQVLVVEDDPVQAQAIEKTLQQEDWTIRVAEGVQEALEALEEGGFDVAIVDHELPDGTGLEVLEAAKIEAPDVPVVYLTGTGNEEVALQALSQGAVRYLTKGEDATEDLPDAIREADEGFHGVSPVEVVEDEPGGSRGSPDTSSLSEGEGAPPSGGQVESRVDSDATNLSDLLGDLVGPPILGIGVFEDGGQVVDARLPEGVEADAAGVLAAAAAHQFEGLAGVFDLELAGQVLLGRGENGTLGVTVVPGPTVVALLMDREVNRERATRMLFQVAAQVHEARG